MQRHLATLKALNAHSGACRLALPAATAGLALAGADAATDAHAPLAGSRIVRNLVELHGAFPWIVAERDADETSAVRAALLLLNHADEMRDLGNHAPRRRRVLQLSDTTDAVKSEAYKGLALVVTASD